MVLPECQKHWSSEWTEASWECYEQQKRVFVLHFGRRVSVKGWFSCLALNVTRGTETWLMLWPGEKVIRRLWCNRRSWLGIKRLRSRSQLFYLLATWSQTNNLIFLSTSFLNCKMEIKNNIWTTSVYFLLNLILSGIPKNIPIFQGWCKSQIKVMQVKCFVAEAYIQGNSTNIFKYLLWAGNI